MHELCVFAGGGSLKASLARVFSLAKFKDCLVGLMAKRIAFTMAEILLSLTIIGVVAAITLPSLTGNINERTWNTQRKALLSRISQAVALMPSLRGYGISSNGGTATNTAETFVVSGLSKVLKLNNVCGYQQIYDCGISPNYVNLVGSKKSWSNPPKFSDLKNQYTNVATGGFATYPAAFETANGESIMVFYNPRCFYPDKEGRWTGGSDRVISEFVCANFIYDLNGKKGPNTFGKDVGYISAVYASDTEVVAPIPLKVELETSTHYEAAKVCTNYDVDSRLPSLAEVASMYVNKSLNVVDLNATSTSGGGVILSSTLVNNKAWRLYVGSGYYYAAERSYGGKIRCVKR